MSYIYIYIIFCLLFCATQLLHYINFFLLKQELLIPSNTLVKYHTAWQLNCLVSSSFTLSRLVHMINEKARGIRHDTYHICSVWGHPKWYVDEDTDENHTTRFKSSQKQHSVVGRAVPDLHMHSDPPKLSQYLPNYVMSHPRKTWTVSITNGSTSYLPESWHLLSSKLNTRQPSFHQYQSTTANTQKTCIKKPYKPNIWIRYILACLVITLNCLQMH